MNKVDRRHETAMHSLHPVFKMRIEQVIEDLKALGWKPVLVYGTRIEAEQKKLHEEGVGAKLSWHVTSTVGLLPSPDRSRIENIHGCAADIIDRRWGWGGPCANKDHQFWKDLGSIAKERGLEWGGDWKKRDVAHIQLKIIESPAQDSYFV